MYGQRAAATALKITLLATLLSIATGCKPRQAPPAPVTQNQPDTRTAQAATAPAQSIATLSAFIHSGSSALQDFQHYCQQLAAATAAFLADNNSETLQQLQASWIDANNHWHSSRFYIASAAQYPQRLAAINQTLASIFSGPISPGYLDSIEGYPNSGLVNDITVPIDEKSIRNQHQRFDLEEAATGLQVLEFFLWQRQPANFDRPPAASQSQILAGIGTEHMPLQRRRQLLSLLVKMLLNDSRQLLQQWSARIEFWPTLAVPQQQLLALNGMLQQLLVMARTSEPSPQDLQWQLAASSQWAQQINGFIAPEWGEKLSADLLKSVADAHSALQKLAGQTEADQPDQWRQQLAVARSELITQLQQQLKP